MTRSVAVLVLVACAAALPLRAERADREKEIVLVADKGLADDQKKTSTFEGNVVITQGTMRVTAAKVTMTEKDNFKYYVASGSPVTFRQKRDNVDEWVDGVAARAEFDDRTDVVKLFNGAHVKSGGNQLTGEFISYDMRTEVAHVMGAPPGQTPPENSRVKVIIVPEKKGPAAKGAEGSKESAPLKTDKDVNK